MDDLANINNRSPTEQAAWSRLEAAEAELAAARAALIEVHNRERAKERTRPFLRLLDGGLA